MKLNLSTPVLEKNLYCQSFKFLFGILLFFQLISNPIFSQVQLSNDVIPTEILTKSILHQQLWKESGLSVNTINTFYILNHGIEALNDLPLNFTIGNKPVVLINKSDIEVLNNTPYFSFHTLNIEDSKALVRIYMSYLFNGETKTNNLELSFVKSNNHWEITDSEI